MDTSEKAETTRDARYLEKCLKAGMRLVCADDGIPVRRALIFSGTLVDVFCVKDIVVTPTHPGSEACQSGGSCSAACRMNNIFIRYEDKGVSKGNHLHVKDEDLIPEMIARLTHEIEHGTDTVVDPEAMLRALAKEVGLRREVERAAPPAAGVPTADGTVAPWLKFVVPDDPATAARRVVTWKGVLVDAQCVTRVEIISAEEMAREYRTTGRGLQYSDGDVAVVRYENSEGAGALYVEVMSPEYNDHLVEQLTHEIQHGTQTLIDLHCIQWALELAFQKNLVRRRARSDVTVPGSSDPDRPFRISRDETAGLIAALSSALAKDNSDVIDLGEMLDCAAGT